jgi:hypothetical protein
LKEVEIDQKLQDLSVGKRIDDLEVQRRDLEITQLKKGIGAFDSPIGQLLHVAQAMVIDNDKTIVGSEPAIRSLWEEDELAELKVLIMKKARQL